MKNIPYGAFAIWMLADKLAGARKLDISQLSREDLFSCNRETEKETGIPFITDVDDDKTRGILAGK